MRSNTCTVTRVSCITHSTQSFLFSSTPLHVSLIFNLTVFHFSFFQSLLHISPSPITVFFPWSRSSSAHPRSPQSFSLSYRVMVPIVSTDTTFLCTDWPPLVLTDWPWTQLFLSFPVHLLLLTTFYSTLCLHSFLFSSQQNNTSTFNWTTSPPILSNLSMLQSVDHRNLLWEVWDSLLSLQGWPSSCSLEMYLGPAASYKYIIAP